ncbi:MAG: hypothetical protein LC740_05210 [Actinobacteria bacterium]|nr:hypothetical protein [Actinomycetota bacterium]
MTEEQRRFFEELLAYLRDELKARKDPEDTEQRARMFASLAGEESCVPSMCRPSWPRWRGLWL